MLLLRVFYDYCLLVYCPHRYRTPIMCDEVADDCLVELRFILGWFVISKVLGKLDNALEANDDIILITKIIKGTFTANQRHIFSVDHGKNNFHKDNNFYEDDPDTINQDRDLIEFWFVIVSFRNQSIVKQDK